MSMDILQSLNEEELAALLFAPFCCYCLKAGEPFEKYTNHYMRNTTGEICCIKLQMDGCPDCGATGKFAHHVSECPLLTINSTIYSVPGSVITGGNNLSNANISSLLERKKRKFKKEKPLRIKLLKRLHSIAVERYWLAMEEDFESNSSDQCYEEINDLDEIEAQTKSRRKSNDPRKLCEYAVEAQCNDLKRKDIDSMQDYNSSKIKRRRLAL